MLDYATARDLVLEQHFDWGKESVALSDAVGRVLRQAVVADRDQPPFDRVAMDGIAVQYAAYAGGRRRFAVSHLAPAGAAPRPLPDPAQCVEVMTGAPLPPGTDTVIRYEDLVRDGDAFTVPEGIAAGKSVHRRATDGRAGDRIVDGSRRIGPAEAAVLATYGLASVTVARQPRVAIASTGDEVVPVDQAPLDHQIRSSNVYQLAALFHRVGIRPTLRHLPDDDRAGLATLQRMLAANDIVLLSGGVSKGKLDHVPDWLAAAGVRKLFHRVAQRPGKPLWVGRTAHTMVFALPGNPASSLVGTVAYLGPWLSRQLGLTGPPQYATLAKEVTFSPALTLFRAVSLREKADGQRAVPVGNSGSGDLLSLLATDGFLVLPADRSTFSAGDRFPYLPLSLP